MKQLTKIARPTPENTKLPDIPTLLLEMLTNYNRQLLMHPYQLLLMQPTGNSTQEVFSLIAMLN